MGIKKICHCCINVLERKMWRHQSHQSGMIEKLLRREPYKKTSVVFYKKQLGVTYARRNSWWRHEDVWACFLSVPHKIHNQYTKTYMGVSWNWGTSKSSLFLWHFPLKNNFFWVPPFLETSPYATTTCAQFVYPIVPNISWSSPGWHIQNVLLLHFWDPKLQSSRQITLATKKNTSSHAMIYRYAICDWSIHVGNRGENVNCSNLIGSAHDDSMFV